MYLKHNYCLACIIKLNEQICYEYGGKEISEHKIYFIFYCVDHAFYTLFCDVIFLCSLNSLIVKTLTLTFRTTNISMASDMLACNLLSAVDE